MVTKNLQSVVLTFIWNEKAYCLGRVAPPCSPCEIPSCCVRTIVRGHIRRQHGIDGHCCTGMNLILIELLLTNSVSVIFWFMVTNWVTNSKNVGSISSNVTTKSSFVGIIRVHLLILISDCLATCCCGPCTLCQEAAQTGSLDDFLLPSVKGSKVDPNGPVLEQPF